MRIKVVIAALAMLFATANVRRIVGTEGAFGEQLGLSKDWAARALKAVGNYGEVYERNVGSQSKLAIPHQALCVELGNIASQDVAFLFVINKRTGPRIRSRVVATSNVRSVAPAAVSATGSRKPDSGRVAHAVNSPTAAKTASAVSGCRELARITIRSSAGRLRAYQATSACKEQPIALTSFSSA